jgi:hypothetical protein
LNGKSVRKSKLSAIAKAVDAPCRESFMPFYTFNGGAPVCDSRIDRQVAGNRAQRILAAVPQLAL